MAPTPLPITAYAICSALGPDRTSTVEGLFEARDGLGPVPFELPFETVAGSLDLDLEPLPPKLAAWSNRPTQMAKHLVDQIQGPLKKARERWSPERIGIVVGTSTSGADATERAYAHWLEHGTLPNGYDFRKQHTFGALADVLRSLCGVRGPAWIVSTTCTSSAKPFGTAKRLIDQGVLDAVIVGGIDTLCVMTLTGFHALGALSSERCRPFSASRKGINIGEGGALLVIERQGEGPGLLEGVGESNDAYHISAPHPEGLGARLAMQRALEAGGVEPHQVDHINAHGTGTTLNDAAESKAITAVFGNEVPVVSTKSYTGHTLGGAGAIEAAISLIVLEEGRIPPSLRVEPRDPKMEIRVATQPIEGSFTRVISNSFAFGGSNCSVLLRSS